MYQKNMSILLPDTVVELNYVISSIVGEKCDPLLCRLKDGVSFNTGLNIETH
jgi:hypothetical protein